MDEILEFVISVLTLLGVSVNSWQEVISLCGGSGALVAIGWKVLKVGFNHTKWTLSPKMDKTTKAIYEAIDSEDRVISEVLVGENTSYDYLIKCKGLNIHTNKIKVESVRIGGLEEIWSDVSPKHQKRINRKLFGSKGIVTDWLTKRKEKIDLNRSQRILSSDSLSADGSKLISACASVNPDGSTTLQKQYHIPKEVFQARKSAAS